MRAPSPTPLVGFWATSLGTLASRILGLARDAATAALFGLAQGGVSDAFVLAFRLPNLFRRLLGEGALAASYLPVLAGELEHDQRRARALATRVVVALAAGLGILLLVGEALCALAWNMTDDPAARLLAGLTAAMLPYLWFVCLAAQLSTTLNALARFSVPALAAALLNVTWLAGAWWIAPAMTSDKIGQAYALAGCVVVAGALQMAVQLVELRRAGFRWQFDRAATRGPALRVLRALGPLALALGITQINTLVDSLAAWGLTAPAGKTTIAWLPGALAYPLAAGATTALYYAERFYQFPVGLVGVAVATAIFPLLSRHAAAGRRAELGTDLVAGLRLVCFATLPAGIGLILLARPLTELLLEHGSFTAADAARTARTTACYAAGICAYALVPVLARGFYAVSDLRAPLAGSLLALGVNVVLDLTLVWPLGESGLALATAVSASLQAGAMLRWFARRHGPLELRPLGVGLSKTICATAAMSAVVLAVPQAVELLGGRCGAGLAVGVGVPAGAGTFFLVARLLRAGELAMLRPRAGGAGNPVQQPAASRRSAA